MKEIEERVFATGVQAETLMDQAGAQIAAAVHQFFPVPGSCLVAFGKGHNGGDALVAARHLAEAGWAIALQAPFAREALAPLTRKKLGELQPSLEIYPPGAERPAVTVVLDGLLGIGAKPGLREPLRGAAKEINRLRRENGAAVFALDIPTGLDGETGKADPDCVEADFTLAVGFAKRGLLADGALDFVGRLAVLPLPELTAQAQAAAAPPQGLESVATPLALSKLRPPRRFGTHKGECGRVGIVAGSRGFTGAAVMAANAAVRAGGGLVSLFVTADVYPIVATMVMPEVMATAVESYLDVLEHPLDTLAIGPGLGKNAFYQDSVDLLALIERFPGPMVVDADALNILGQNTGSNLWALHQRSGPRLLTPHPGEMRRLFPEAQTLSRRETATRFLALFKEGEETGKNPITLLLKGSRTLVAQRVPGHGPDDLFGCRISYNSTGNPGMASGGMGDVLTGTCAALAGQGLALFDAARLGAWVSGRAAEQAVAHGWRSHESLCASDLLEFYGGAFNELRGIGGGGF